jgi:hypothetical protein
MLRKLRKLWYYQGLQKGYELGLKRKSIEKPAGDAHLTDEINDILDKEGF